MPLTIGLTGGIGAGKSSVAELLAERGAEIVSGDEIGKVVVETSPQILAHIRERFGDEVFDSTGALHRRELGGRVFATLADARWLTEITRDPILELWRQRVRECTAAVIVLDAALIFEWGVESEFDLTVSVSAPPLQIARRLLVSGRFTPAEASKRLAAQFDPEYKAGHSDYRILNDQSPELLREHVEHLWSTLIQPELTRKQQPKHG